jgi:SAM-dependent methyltransferase
MRAVTSHTDPISGAVPRSSPARTFWRLKHRVRSLLGARRGFKVDGFYYKETATELLARALSRKGKGEKEYRVTFPDGSKMMIHCSMRRPYADLMGPVMLPQFQRAQGMIRPGMRVLAAPCGTGNAVRWLSERVGPSGAVVALDTDAESIAYAQRRYARPNVAFECSGVAGLSGEIDGSFDAAFVISLDPGGIRADQASEVWRVTAPGGWVLLGCPVEVPRSQVQEFVGSMKESEDDGAAAAQAEWLSTSEDAFHAVLVRKLTAQ